MAATSFMVHFNAARIHQVRMMDAHEPGLCQLLFQVLDPFGHRNDPARSELQLAVAAVGLGVKDIVHVYELYAVHRGNGEALLDRPF